MAEEQSAKQPFAREGRNWPGTDSADFTEIQPTEHRADGVITLMQDDPVMGIVVAAQLDRDDRKRYIWPVYAVNLRGVLAASWTATDPWGIST